MFLFDYLLMAILSNDKEFVNLIYFEICLVIYFNSLYLEIFYVELYWFFYIGLMIWIHQDFIT